jgi:hypothetical protein
MQKIKSNAYNFQKIRGNYTGDKLGDLVDPIEKIPS